MPTGRAKTRRPRSGASRSSRKPATRARRRKAAAAAGPARELATVRRAERLRADSRNAILVTREALRQQFREALGAQKVDAAEQLRGNISALTDQLDELSQISLDALEESDEVKRIILQLGASAADLEKEAARITDLTSALREGAQSVQKATEIVGALKGLIPIG